MRGTPSNDWYIRQHKEAAKDLRYKAECTLLELEEYLWQKYGKPVGRYKVYYWLMEGCANKLIWRKAGK